MPEKGVSRAALFGLVKDPIGWYQVIAFGSAFVGIGAREEAWDDESLCDRTSGLDVSVSSAMHGGDGGSGGQVQFSLFLRHAEQTGLDSSHLHLH